MYEARFALADRELRSSVLRSDAFTFQDACFALGPITSGLAQAVGPGGAIRLEFRDGKVLITLIASSWAEAGLPPSRVLDELSRTAGKRAGWSAAKSSSQFDAIAADFPPLQLGVDHTGFEVSGHPVGCRFSICRCLEEILTMVGDRNGRLIYQINLSRWNPDRETERRVRKEILHLKTSEVAPRGVIQLQEELALRLTQRGFLTEEFLALDNSSSYEVITQILDDQFERQMGSLGFEASPIERGDFTEFVASGFHSQFLAEAPLRRSATPLPGSQLRKWPTFGVNLPGFRSAQHLLNSTQQFLLRFSSAIHQMTSTSQRVFVLILKMRDSAAGLRRGALSRANHTQKLSSVDWNARVAWF
ncbi:MAG: hypothetical protein ACI8UO_004749 [Verrucomicrobiales bacterium]|jgi:hypothetical protein